MSMEEVDEFVAPQTGDGSSEGDPRCSWDNAGQGNGSDGVDAAYAGEDGFARRSKARTSANFHAQTGQKSTGLHP